MSTTGKGPAKTPPNPNPTPSPGALYPPLANDEEELPELEQKHITALREMQENCYKHLHRPMVVKARGFKDEIWYICQECLDNYVEANPELKKLIIAFRR